jgi:preprotein translocase subunit SecG
MDIEEKSINSKPKSLDNFDNPHTSIKEGINIENDNDLNKAMSSLMTEYAKENGSKEGMAASSSLSSSGSLTGTSLNLNLLQGDLFTYGKYDMNKNPIQPFTVERMREGFASSGAAVGGGGNGGSVVSYKEGLSNDDDTSKGTVSASKTGTTTASKSQKLLDLEKKLSELTSEYTSQYRIQTEDMLTRSRFLQTNSLYLNKLVRDLSYTGSDANAAFYYVNPFGYTHRYKDLSSVMLYDAKTCPAITRSDALPSDDKTNPFKITPASFVDISSGSVNGGFSKFSDLASYDMTGYTPCITTKNVKLPGASSSEDKYAWVDFEGRKHVYEKGVWPDKRHSTCLTAVVGEPIVLTANQYNSIPTAEDAPMKEESECFRASVSPTIHTKLAEIKKKIDDTVAEIKKENQNILNAAASTTIIQRDKTLAEKWASLDDDILAQVKKILGDYYYPVVYVFWCFIILVAVLMVFKFAFLFISPGGGGGGGSGIDGGNGDPNRSGTNMSLLGIVIMVLIVIFAVYYYFSYTYNLDVNITHNDTVYTTV